MKKNTGPKFETLTQKAKKKKDFIVVTIIFGIVSFLLISFGLAFIGSEEQEVFKERKENIIKDKEFSIVKKQDFKENWAIAMENRIDKQAENMEKFQKDMKAENKQTMEDIKNLILESNANQNKKIDDFSSVVSTQITDLKNNVELRFSEQQNQIEDISLRNSVDGSYSSNDNSEGREQIILGKDLLPPTPTDTVLNDEELSIDDSLNALLLPKNTNKEDIPKTENKKENNKKEPKKTSTKKTVKKYTPPKVVIKMVEVDTSSIQKEVEKEEKLLAELEQLRLKKNNSFHLMTGLTQAFMITGAYAPAFDSGDEEPLPVLFQAEGDILIANDDSQTIDKCLLIGSAKGNMNSQTADIRLVKISCSLGEGTKKIEGEISGWVIGENGIPGVQGELLHKNGAWLSKTFVSGFLETFSSALDNTGTTEINIGGSDDSTVPIGTAVSDNTASAAAGGLSSVFGKLGEYYLEMAEQIFPVIEVKAGRTVNILLKGGETFTVSDFNKLDLTSINDTIEDEEYFKEKVGQEEYIKLKRQLEDAEDSKDKNAVANILDGEQKQNAPKSSNFELEGRN